MGISWTKGAILKNLGKGNETISLDESTCSYVKLDMRYHVNWIPGLKSNCKSGFIELVLTASNAFPQLRSH